MAETLSAASSLVETVFSLAGIIYKVAYARKDAEALYKRHKALEELSVNIESFLKRRVERGETPRPEERRAVRTLKRSLDDCKKFLDKVHQQLKPLNRVPTSQAAELSNRLKHVLTEKFTSTLQETLASHQKDLDSSFSMLSAFRQDSHQEDIEKKLDYLQEGQELTQRRVEDVLQVLQQIAAELIASSPSRTATGLDLSSLQEEIEVIVKDLAPVQDKDPLRDDGEVQNPRDERPVATRSSNLPGTDGKKPREDSAIWRAVKENDAEEVRKLHDRGANIYLNHKEDGTLLHEAVLHKADAALSALLDLSPPEQLPAWIETRKQGMTPLMYIAHLFSPENSPTTADRYQGMAEVLLSRGSDINATDSDGRSALYFVVEGTPVTETIRFVDFLLDNHADPKPALKFDHRNAIRYPKLREIYEARRNQTGSDESLGSSDDQTSDTEGPNRARHKSRVGSLIGKVLSHPT